MSRTSPYSVRANAERYLRHAGRWVGYAELCTHLSVHISTLSPSVKPEIVAGRMQRKKGADGLTYLRMAPAEPVRTFSIDFPPGYRPQLATGAL